MKFAERSSLFVTACFASICGLSLSLSSDLETGIASDMITSDEPDESILGKRFHWRRDATTGLHRLSKRAADINNLLAEIAALQDYASEYGKRQMPQAQYVHRVAPVRIGKRYYQPANYLLEPNYFSHYAESPSRDASDDVTKRDGDEDGVEEITAKKGATGRPGTPLRFGKRFWFPRKFFVNGRPVVK